MSHTSQTAESFNQAHRGAIECPCRECQRKDGEILKRDIQIHELELKVKLYFGLAGMFAKKLKKNIGNEPSSSK